MSRTELEKDVGARLANPGYEVAIARAVLQRAGRQTRLRRLAAAAVIILGIGIGVGTWLGQSPMDRSGQMPEVAEVQFIGDGILTAEGALNDDETDVLLQAAAVR